jgi:uncharacterized protein YozE (UPF0346 family)
VSRQCPGTLKGVCVPVSRPLRGDTRHTPPDGRGSEKNRPAHWTSFTGWLRHQRHRTGSVGSLAADMAGDGGWPEPATLAEMHAYLDRYAAPWFVHQALDEAWAEYLREAGP